MIPMPRDDGQHAMPGMPKHPDESASERYARHSRDLLIVVCAFLAVLVIVSLIVGAVYISPPG